MSTVKVHNDNLSPKMKKELMQQVKFDDHLINFSTSVFDQSSSSCAVIKSDQRAT